MSIADAFSRWLKEVQYKAWEEGFDAGQKSAYIGRYDQFDTGSLMFKRGVENPYLKEEE